MTGIGEIGERLRRATVQIRAGRNSGGSGVIWNRDGRIITNAHVAREGPVGVELWDGRKYEARVEKHDSRRDLALLQVRAPDLAAAEVGDSDRIRVGELVIAVGNPLGFTGALSTGVVHGVGPIQGLGSREFIHATVRLAPGNSGGPLANAMGNIIGINTMVVSGGLGLAVPSNIVARFMTAAAPIELGVTVRLARIRGAASGIGLIVLGVAAGSPAERASLQVGDVLTAVNGGELRSIDDLGGILDRNPGRAVTVQFLRGDHRKQREVAVQLVEGVAA